MLCLYGNFCQPVDNVPSDWRFIIRHKQNFLAFLITLYLLKNLTGQYKCIQIPNLAPVNRFRNFRSSIIITRTYQRLHLVNFQFKLVFIHARHHLSAKDANAPISITFSIITQCQFTIGNRSCQKTR